jgi:hypothetical protein
MLDLSDYKNDSNYLQCFLYEFYNGADQIEENQLKGGPVYKLCEYDYASKSNDH